MTPTQENGGERLFFGKVKEGRGNYFVEYQPPNAETRFATLDVVFHNRIDIREVPSIMETEARAWIDRYPVPLRVSSFDEAGDLQNLSPVRNCDHLIAFKDRSKGTPCLHWDPVPDQQIPDDALNTAWLKQVYFGIPFKTQAEVDDEAKVYVKQIRSGWWIVLGWVSVLPAVWALAEWAGPPRLLETIVTAYAVTKAVVEGLKLSGKWKKSPQELQGEEEKRRMRHYYYHCEMNPDGFMRLKSENLEREEKDTIQREAASLNVNLHKKH